MSLIRKFLLDDPTPAEIVNVRLETDGEQWGAICARIEQAKQSLGEKWIAHPANRVQRIDTRDEAAA